MIVPEYWAEATVKEKIGKGNVTIRRFGWSDVSEAEAEKHARERAAEAMGRARSGEKIRRIDHKTSYNGAEGIPIREEVVARYGDTVITRNIYGALCLNTPDVFFSDIDFIEKSPLKFSFRILVEFLVAAGVLGYVYGSGMLFGIGAVVSPILAFVLPSFVHMMQEKKNGGAEGIARQAIEAFVENHPEFHLRLYRTPMGYRILAMHRTFEPDSDATRDLLTEMKTDPVYAQMCRNQNCFRARISPKPWRIGMQRLGPSPGIWPIRPERMPARNQWVDQYTERAKGYASCRFVASLGTGMTDPKAEKVRDLHDRYCMSDREIPLA